MPLSATLKTLIRSAWDDGYPLLVATVGFLSSLWTGAVTAGAWTGSVLVIHAVMISKCRQFLELPMADVVARSWRLRFITLDLCYGLAWTFMSATCCAKADTRVAVSSILVERLRIS